MDRLAEILEERGWGGRAIGVEMDNYYFSAAAFAALERHLPNAAFRDATGLVNWQRAVKSEQELAYMGTAARIVEAMYARILEVAEPGRRKNELVAEIYHAGITGIEGHGGDYPAIVPLLPTGVDGAFLEAEKALLEGIEAGLEIARPGNTCEMFAAAFFDVLARYGIEKSSRCGYSIGLSYPPDWGERTMSLRPGDASVLEANMTFHFMPGLWFDDWGIEITESVVITARGAVPLATVPRKLFVKN